MIRSSKHNLIYANKQKRIALIEFLIEYRIATQNYIDYIWEHPIYLNDQLVFDLKQDILNLPSYLDYSLIKFQTKLSARALSSASTQACGIVKGVVRRRSKYLWIKQQLILENKPTHFIENKLEKITFSKPIITERFKAELSSKCADYKEVNNSKYFAGFLRLKSLGEFEHILIPIKHYRHMEKWNANGKQLGSFLISQDYICLRFELTDPSKKETGIIVGADTGLKTILTLSDHQSTPLTNPHGYSLEDICTVLSGRKKGSQGFRKAQAHRTNFINWSINQLNFENIKQINLEKVNNLFFHNSVSKVMARWTNQQIEQKILAKAEEAGVQIKLQSCVYRSQRCSTCGWVAKQNRKKKIFFCLQCGFTEDADYNASLNHQQEIPKVPIWLASLSLNKSGFFWRETGFFNLMDQEILVPDAHKE